MERNQGCINIQPQNHGEEVWQRLFDLFEERHFDKLETNVLLIGSLAAHEKMVRILEDNPSMTEDEFLLETERIEA